MKREVTREERNVERQTKKKNYWGQCKQPPYRHTDIVQHILAVLSPDPFKSHLSNVPFYSSSKEPMVVGRKKKGKENWRKGEGEEDNRINHSVFWHRGEKKCNIPIVKT